MKKDILIFCSWLDVDTNVGVFFSEQASIISDIYNPILVVFKPQILSKKYFNYYNRTQIIEKKSKDNLIVFEVYYARKEILGRKLNDYFEQLALEKLQNHLVNREILPVFIHAHSIFDAGIWAYKYSSTFNIPFIITEHQQLSFLNIPKYKSQLAIRSLKAATIYLAVSNDKIRQFAANGLFFDFKNIGNLISKNFYINPIISKSEKLRFITIGALSPIKDFRTIFKALEIVDKQLTQKAEFIWIGQNSWGKKNDESVQELLSNYNFTNIDIILEPILNRDQIATYLNSAHLFLFSSLSEGMPVSVLEALACGLAVFTSNCGGVDEIITEQNGKIYQIKDHQTLANLIIDFTNQSHSYDADSISKTILEKYGETAFRKKLLTYYMQVENSRVI